MYKDIKEVDGFNYSSPKIAQATQEIKAQAYKDIKAMLDETNLLLFASLTALFVWIWNKHTAYLKSQANLDIWGMPNEIKNSVIDDIYAKMHYEIEISGSYGQRALINSHNKLFYDIADLMDKISVEELDEADISTRLDEILNKYAFRQRRIYRTEEHRVQEMAKYQSAKNMYNQGIKSVKRWNTQEDNRVRNTDHASHVDMEGQTQDINVKFNLVPFGETDCPGNSGIADQDINCRCYCTYE